MELLAWELRRPDAVTWGLLLIEPPNYSSRSSRAGSVIRAGDDPFACRRRLGDCARRQSEQVSDRSLEGTDCRHSPFRRPFITPASDLNLS